MILTKLHPERQQLLLKVLDVGIFTVGLVAIAALIVEFGFYLPAEWLPWLQEGVRVLVLCFVVQEILRWLFVTDFRGYLRQRWFENLIAIGALFSLLFPSIVQRGIHRILPGLSFVQITLLYLGVSQLLVVISMVVKLVRYNEALARLKLSPSALFLLSFLFLIALGTLLLLLPRATTAPLGFIDALFTATSAVCVTGLIVVDTATAFTAQGKLILLLLIQIGGLGIMTLTTFLALFFSGGISIRERLMLSTILSEENLGEVASLLVRIAMYTFVIEAIGAVLLYLSYGEIGQWDVRKLSFAVFHAVSAFCNAGFSLYSANLADPEVQYNVQWTAVVAMLVILGGLGVSVLSNLAELRPWKALVYRVQHRLTLHTKLVLSTTAVLLVVGTVGIALFEWNHLYKDMPVWERLYRAFFFSVTARTAGFNIDPVETLSLPSVFLLLMLMWIGASPGSTGGGIKTTTFAVAALNVMNIVRGKQRVEIFYRQIPIENIRRAFSIVLLTAFFIGAMTVLLLVFEPDKALEDLLFEVTSAVGTVGLSRGITAELSWQGKVVLIVAMFVGRVGILTLLFALFRQEYEPRYKFPVENVIVG